MQLDQAFGEIFAIALAVYGGGFPRLDESQQRFLRRQCGIFGGVSYIGHRNLLVRSVG